MGYKWFKNIDKVEQKKEESIHTAMGKNADSIKKNDLKNISNNFKITKVNINELLNKINQLEKLIQKNINIKINLNLYELGLNKKNLREVLDRISKFKKNYLSETEIYEEDINEVSEVIIKFIKLLEKIEPLGNETSNTDDSTQFVKIISTSELKGVIEPSVQTRLIVKVNSGSEKMENSCDRVYSHINNDTNKENFTDGIKEAIQWDPKQKLIIELPETNNVIIEAGPGSGKTEVACARVAWLAEEAGLEPSKILLISFTRTAVKELSSRIEKHARDSLNVKGVRILTLDSFTWQILKGFGENTTSIIDSYDLNIQKFINKLDAETIDEDLEYYLEEFEHVIIDEGQDLVGIRSELMVKFIRHTPAHCGISVFADNAQAIYGFTDDYGHSNDCHGNLLECIYEGTAGVFEKEILEKVHRTDDKKLLNLYKIGRERLSSLKKGSQDDWKNLKDTISTIAHGEFNDVHTIAFDNSKKNLVLFRTRAEVLFASSFLWSNGINHKIRMSGMIPKIHPWIARAFNDYVEDYIEKDKFYTIWDSKIGSESIGEFNKSNSWDLLYKHVSTKNQTVDIRRLREILSRDRVDLDFLIDENDLPGPILGTIHASKGREADHVYLMLPNDNFIKYHDDEAALAEEERVLYVGATRAKEKLFIGNGNILYATRLPSGRTYRRTKYKGYQVEIGRDGDFEFLRCIDKGSSTSEYAVALQNWLWDNRNNSYLLYSEYKSETERHHIFTDGNNDFIGAFSKSFNYDLWQIVNNTGKSRPPLSIKNIRMVGAVTQVIPDKNRSQCHSPYCNSGFILVPVISGFPTLYIY